MPDGRKKDASRQLQELQAVFDALAHPQRRQILLVLHFRGGEVPAGDIADRFACSWPTTTRHLGVLRDAGLIDVALAGRRRLYRLNEDRLHGVVGDWLANFRPAERKKTRKTRT